MSRDVLDELAALPPPQPPPLSSVLEAELGKLAPVATRRPLRELAILVGISVVYGAGLLAVITMRRDARELPMWWLAGMTILWIAGFVVPCYLALVPRSGAVTPRWRWAAASAVVTSILFIALNLIVGMTVHPHGEDSLYYGWERFGHGHTCLEFGLATALVPVIVGAMFLRGAVPVRSRLVAAALGAGSGSLGGLVLHLHCRIADGLHIGLMHGGVVIIAALLSAALVPRATDQPLR
jgi:uncharacterized membrane protein YhdT